MKFRNIIFDWDGTLADTVETWMQVWQNAYKAENLMIEYDELVQAVIEDWQRAPEKFGILDSKGFISKAISENIHLLINSPRVRGVDILLDNLKDRSLFICSAGLKEIINAWNSDKNYESLFKLIIDKDDVSRQKPDPEGILKIIEQASLNKKETIMVGDSINDMKAAKKAGIKSVWLRNRHFVNPAYIPDYIIDSMDELLDIV